MKNNHRTFFSRNALLATVVLTLFMQNKLFAEVTAGKTYDVASRIELRSGPSETSSKKVNEKATRMLKSTIYLSIDSSTTVKVHSIDGDWVEVQVTEPQHLRASHRGWIPVSALKTGDSSKKMSGWIRHTCKVYKDPDLQSEVVGILSKPSSVGVADDGSGWLKLVHGPVKDSKTLKYLDSSEMPENLYIERKNFTETMPGKW